MLIFFMYYYSYIRDIISPLLLCYNVQFVIYYLCYNVLLYLINKLVSTFCCYTSSLSSVCYDHTYALHNSNTSHYYQYMNICIYIYIYIYYPPQGSLVKNIYLLYESN